MFFDKYELLCRNKGISLSKAADEIGFNRSSITKWKNKGFTPRQEILVKIADYFNVTIDYLLGNEQRKTSADNDEGFDRNIIKIAGRDGSFVERNLTDEQLDLFKKMIDQMPDTDNL